MRKSSGYRRSTRNIFRKRPRERGMRSLDYLLEEFKVGDIIDIIIDSSVQKGMPHRRYHGKTGIITKHQGNAYVINIKQGNITKKIVTTKEHIRLSRSTIRK